MLYNISRNKCKVHMHQHCIMIHRRKNKTNKVMQNNLLEIMGLKEVQSLNIPKIEKLKYQNNIPLRPWLTTVPGPWESCSRNLGSQSGPRLTRVPIGGILALISLLPLSLSSLSSSSSSSPLSPPTWGGGFLTYSTRSSCGNKWVI